jgi:aspartyl-tRNA(Asn)/glutamyl-tRNA(Gln) amidotransferase subunit B
MKIEESFSKYEPVIGLEVHAQMLTNSKAYCSDGYVYDAQLLTENKDIAEYFESITKHISNSEAVANWLMVIIKEYLNKQAISIQDFVLQAAQIAESLNLLQESVLGELQKWIDEALAINPEKVLEYKAGKQSLMGLFMGEVMKYSKGKADPKLSTQMLKKTLES